MKTKVFVWDNNKQGESATFTLKRLTEFAETVDVLFITQGVFYGSIMGYTVFYKDKL